MEKYIESFVYENKMIAAEQEELTTHDRIEYSKDQVIEIIKKVWLYIFIGVGIGAAIHNWIPESIIEALLGQDKWYSVLLATVVAMPMYADIFGTLPIAEALIGKGVGLGTVLAFMMGVTALSLPSIILLKTVVKPKLLAIFIAVVTVGILIIGYTFNIFGHLLM